MAGVSTIIGGLIFFLHCCFFKHPKQQDDLTGFELHAKNADCIQPNRLQEESKEVVEMGYSNDHSMAFLGPGDKEKNATALKHKE